MQKLAFTVLLLLSLATTVWARQPNVILIYTDDQGTIDVNCFGAKDLTTPHMDGLAKRGVKFTQFYSAAPVCSPSRAAVITGRYPQRAQIPGNVSSHHGNAGMPASQITLAEVFKQAGYSTAHIGKWHLGYDNATMPNNQGFDYSFGHMGGCIDNYSHFFYWNGPNRHDLWKNGNEIWRDGDYFPQLMVDEASAFIRAQDDSPFFMYFALNIPHYPLQGTEKWRQHYKEMPAPRRMYAALISTMDEMIGKLVAEVDQLGLREDTIIVFQSDHGHSQEERTFGGGGSAGIYRGAKFSLFEGGIRVPAIISWPGQLPEGETRDQLATAIDWYPTVTKLAGIEPITHRIDGQDISKLIQSSEAPSPHNVFHWQTGRGNKAPWAVRKGDWKLQGNPRDTSNKAPLTAADKLFLTNLKDDPSEMTNVAKNHPELVKELLKLHQSWIVEVEKQ
tara:strand:- start:3811 stop:5151 length:1341 start_codon:yes stop_codon:yes gene_type:complete